MRIGLKLTAAFLVIALLVAAAGYHAQRTGRELKGQMERLSQNAIRRTAEVTEVTVALYADQVAARREIAARRNTEDGPSSSRVEQLDGTVDEFAAESGKADDSRADELSELVRSLSNASSVDLQREFDRHRQMMNQFLGMLDEDVNAAERFLEDSVHGHFEKVLLPQLDAVREQAERESTGRIRGVERALAVADLRRGMLLVATAAIAVSIGLFMSRSIGKPLGRLQQAAQEIGRGCLDTRVTIRSRDEIGTLAASLNQMAAQLREKTVSKDHVDNIIHSMREMLIVTDGELRIREVNPATCSELGYSAADLMDRPLQDLFEEVDLFPHGKLSGAASGSEGLMRTESGSRIPVHFSAAEMRDEAGRMTGIVCVALNVSRQKETEHQLRASLHEKELLLKEVHHRVKNNLQVISSLLSLQSQEIRDPEMIRMFHESQARVRSMALIHEQLYRSDDLARVSFAAYVQELVDNLKQGFGSTAARVNFLLNIQPVPILLDVAIPCGMIVNELVANALEHAFPEDCPGEIRIDFDGDGDGYRLTVADNGLGMPDGSSAPETASIGLKVVQALTRQIHGTLEHSFRGGTTFTIQFQNPEKQASAVEDLS